MRICIISREYPPETGWGGIGAYSYLHANTLAELGHDVEVIALTPEFVTEVPPPANGALPGSPLNIKLHRVPWSNSLSELKLIEKLLPFSHYVLKCVAGLWKTFYKVHLEKPFDVVEAPEHLAEALFPAITKACPLVVRLHTPQFKIVDEGFHNLTPNFDQQLTGMFERMTILQADLVTSPSENLAKYVCNDTGLPLNSVCMIANPVDATKFSPEGEKTFPSDGRLTVLFAGRLEERKGIYQLIDAVPDIVREVPNVRFILLGKDTETGVGRTSAKKILQDKLAANGCTSNVEFVDHVNLNQMPACYRSADVCVVPSLYDNAPYTVLEAMSCGKPIVAASSGGIPEYVVSNKTGLLVEPGDVKGLATALTMILKDATMREQFGQAARERILRVYDKKEVAAKTVEAYKVAIALHKSKRETSAYRKNPDEAIADFSTFIYSYQRNLYEFMYLNSLSFRLQHWKTLAKNQPQLFKDKVTLGFGSILSRLLRQPWPLRDYLDKSRQKITATEEEMQRSVRKELLHL
jgi:glycosyltransferase involved in cell wall biosynthesis